MSDKERKSKEKCQKMSVGNSEGERHTRLVTVNVPQLPFPLLIDVRDLLLGYVVNEVIHMIPALHHITSPQSRHLH